MFLHVYVWTHEDVIQVQWRPKAVGGSHPPRLFPLILSGRVTQSNPELTDLASLNSLLRDPVLAF